ncbi:hypothetical protein MXMO3_01761 [Maritalea myrionectae]|uniref:HNH domain-containing protein n=1 Tax=Maritalea myrionectae TaxID=454601 RepID=A0A2R4MEH3_9HYPH|nr:HNH endonuclease [Maritalea myrionectae]AVX04286.1 hypothetical protein MXMO3_01761 [Maritalea myrionectae]
MGAKQRERIVRYRQLSFIRQGGRCYYCNRRMWERSAEHRLDAMRRLGLTRTELKFRLCTAEHLQRKADQGTNARKNIVAACFDCNQSRGETCPTVHKANRYLPEPVQDDPEIKQIFTRLKNMGPRTAPAIELYAKAKFLRTAQLARELGMEVAL